MFLIPGGKALVEAVVDEMTVQIAFRAVDRTTQIYVALESDLSGRTKRTTQVGYRLLYRIQLPMKTVLNRTRNADSGRSGFAVSDNISSRISAGVISSASGI